MEENFNTTEDDVPGGAPVRALRLRGPGVERAAHRRGPQQACPGSLQQQRHPRYDNAAAN